MNNACSFNVVIKIETVFWLTRYRLFYMRTRIENGNLKDKNVKKIANNF